MNAVVDLLSRDSLFAKAAAVSISGLAWVLMLRPQVDPDFWWHLRVAEFVRDTGDVPRTDFLSWQALGEPWVAHSWLHDLAMWTAYSIGGASGVGMLGALMAAVVVLLAFRLFVVVLPESAPLVWAFGALGVAIIGGPVWSPRAQIWDVIFLLVAAIGWLTYRSTGRRFWLVAMVPLGAAWAALHGSGIGAYVVSAFALAVVVLFGWLPAGRSRLVLAAFVVATVLAMAVGPYGFGLLSYPFETIFSPAQARLIDEWAAPDLGDARFIGLRIALLVAPVLLLLGRRFPDPLIGLLALGWSWLALGSARYLAIAAPFVVAAVLPSAEAIRLRVVRRRPADRSISSGRGRWQCSCSCRCSSLSGGLAFHRRRRTRRLPSAIPFSRLRRSSTTPARAGSGTSTTGVATSRTAGDSPWELTGLPTPSVIPALRRTRTRLAATTRSHRRWPMSRSVWRSLLRGAHLPSDLRHSRAGNDSPAMLSASSGRNRGRAREPVATPPSSRITTLRATLQYARNPAESSQRVLAHWYSRAPSRCCYSGATCHTFSGRSNFEAQ